MKKTLFFLLCGLFVMFTNTNAQNSFYVLNPEYPSYVETMSNNGRYVVGGVNQYVAYFWDLDTQTFQYLSSGLTKEGTELFGVTSDGVGVGSFRDHNYMIEIPDWEDGGEGEITPVPLRVAGIWENGTWTSLGIGYLNLEELTSHEFGSEAYDITADKKMVVGRLNRPGYNAAPCAWKYNEGTSSWDFIEYAYGSNRSAIITSVSADGSVACGWAVHNITGSRIPIIWTSPQDYILVGNEDPLVVKLGEAKKVSENGKYVAFDVGGKAAIYSVETNTYKTIDTHAGAQSSTITSVTNDGFAVGYSEFVEMFGGRWRIAFVYSDALGVMDFQEFLQTFAPDVIIPLFIDFSPTSRILSVISAISADGKTITGWNGPGVDARYSWVLKLENELIIRNKPHNLSAAVSNRNQVDLAWEAPAPSGEETFAGYKVYRDGTVIATLGTDALSYTDIVEVGGAHTYHVVATYSGGDSPASNSVSVNIIDNYDIPFAETFDSADFSLNFWTGDLDRSKWKILTFPFPQGLSGYGATYQNDPYSGITSYSDALISKSLDATSLTQIYLSYAFKFTSGDITNQNDKLSVEVFDGTNWVLIKEYLPNVASYGYVNEVIDISDKIAGKLFQVRFYAQGSNQANVSWTIDNFIVHTEKTQGEAPSDLLGEVVDESGDKQVDLVWTNTFGAYELTYINDPLNLNATGNNGNPFITAISFSSDELKKYNNMYLTSMSVDINQFVSGGLSTKVALVVFEDNIKIREQEIVFFVPNMMNIVKLVSPVLIQEGKELKFGVKVLQHDAEESPVTYQPNLISVPGKSDLLSEDDGASWVNVSTMEGGFPCTWAIMANITESDDVEVPLSLDESIYGYNIYKDGMKINDKLLPFSKNFTDKSYIESACYTVSAYYKDGSESPLSPEYCLVPLGINDNQANDGMWIYPNPTVDYINIAGEFTTASVINLTGKVIIITTESKIDISSLPKGIYLLNISTDNGIVSRKIMKQ